jgi:hypothetical protein
VPVATRITIQPAVGVVASSVTRHPVQRMMSSHPTRTSQDAWCGLSRNARFSVRIRTHSARAIMLARQMAVNGRGSERMKMRYRVRFWRW